MVREAFQFTITLPADAEALPLFHELSRSMSRYFGLEEDEARQVGDVLDRLVTDRVKQVAPGGGPISVSFERPQTASTVTVEVTSSSGGRHAGAAHGDGHARVRLSWRVRDDA
jgi:hypothetical protein